VAPRADTSVGIGWKKVNDRPRLCDLLRVREERGDTMFRNLRVRTGFGWPLLAILLGSLSSTACYFGEVYVTDPFGREYSLTEIQLSYTSLVRWSAFHKAVRYVAPEARDEFVALAPPMKKFRFTDFQSGPVDIDKETGEATVEVTYTGYSTASPFEVEIRETQHWKRSGMGNNWQVTPEFDGLEKVVGLAASS
jgi:hypothetical protein